MFGSPILTVRGALLRDFFCPVLSPQNPANSVTFKVAWLVHSHRRIEGRPGVFCRCCWLFSSWAVLNRCCRRERTPRALQPVANMRSCFLPAPLMEMPARLFVFCRRCLGTLARRVQPRLQTRRCPRRPLPRRWGSGASCTGRPTPRAGRLLLILSISGNALLLLSRTPRAIGWRLRFITAPST